MRGEPTYARPSSGPERFWRWCQRKPALAAAIGCASVAILLGFAGILWQWRRAEQQKVVAQHNELAAREGLYAADMSLIQQTLR